jgi:hypothetical protein
MTKGEKIILVAEKEIGYTENPPGTNKTKYGKWFGFDGVAWCGMFVSWCYYHAGFSLGNIGFSKGFAGCGTAYDHFRKTGQLTLTPVAGDIVLLDWNGDGRYDHTCIFVKKISDTTFESIEGNTSVTNQSNGGQVQRRSRPYSKAVFVHPKILDK